MDWKRRLACAVALFALSGAALLFASISVRAESEGERIVMAQEERLPSGVTFVGEADGIREYKLANGMK
ncbi:MAG: hypothetical protein ICV68_13735, partial [Pyrinomonadaceae bacterium]|nr:hypothetical protein [Pyrinomonadaceae bacterium]